MVLFRLNSRWLVPCSLILTRQVDSGNIFAPYVTSARLQNFVSLGTMGPAWKLGRGAGVRLASGL